MTTTTDPRPGAPGRPAPWRPRIDTRPLPMTTAAAHSLEEGHRAWALILRTPCSRHDASSGAPCWASPTETGGQATGACGMRVLTARRAHRPGRSRRKGASRR